MTTETTAAVTRRRGLSMQVCVPRNWTDEQALTFAERENPCGTENGWSQRRQGDEALGGADERVQCADRPDHVHISYDV